MRTEHIVIDYRLTFEAAFHCGTGLRGGLVHRLVARDAEEYLYIPGSTFKGVLRERCEQLARLWGLKASVPYPENWREANPIPDIVGRTFGSRFHPSHLAFDDALMLKEDRGLFEHSSREKSVRDLRRPAFRAWQTEKRTQVSLSRLTGTANSGMLYTSEYGVRALRFAGQIMGMLTGVPLLDGEHGTFPLLLLVSGLLSLDRIGGNKSSGAGKFTGTIQGVTVDKQPMSIEALLEQLPWFDLYDDAKEEAL
jgi:CRISPR/Cas system CSM-associated protein Csm3 (group 7 of RAMP superfamily)